MKTILVTGCLGTIGIKTINYLLANTDYNIIGVDNCISNPYERIHKIKYTKDRFKFYDCLYKPSNGAGFPVFRWHKIDCVLHLAGIIGITSTTKLSHDKDGNLNYFKNNENFTLELLNYCHQYNVSKFIFASSSAVYGNVNKKVDETEFLSPVSMYGISKMNCENYVNYYNRVYDMNTIILRYSNVLTVTDIKYEGYEGFIPKITKKIINDEKITLYNNGESKRQYIFIDNVVEANVLAIENDNVSGETFNITVDDEPISLITTCNYLYSKFKKNTNYFIEDKKQLGDIDCNWLDNTKAKNMLNYKVITNMYEGIDNYIDYAKNNIKKDLHDESFYYELHAFSYHEY